MNSKHYENFPVASWLCPPAQRADVMALYRFARTADDLADEGEASTQTRQEALRRYRQDLRLCLSGGQPEGPWTQDVFAPLTASHARRHWPIALLEDLLDAFEQDLLVHRYASRTEVLDYCRRSANPVGRLLLHLWGVKDPASLRQSDAICSALQLINFWQDLSVDGPRQRLYAPLEDLQRHGVTAPELIGLRDSPAARALIKDLCDWARALMHEGASLPLQLGGRVGWELRLVVQGGLRILDKLENMQFAALLQRPTLSTWDWPLLLWRAGRMPATTALTAQEPA
ncbi:squalene synthase HpnC [Roseateles sp. BYS180W]|uniref:Squalene synthase HpnC n=1 Tax=Roseateles rivi TaxID=3299028 RepID=A0ABW7FW29_9BURK